MERLIATCGLDCASCPAYQVTREGDSKALEALAMTWSEEYGATLTAEDCACMSCHSATGPWMSRCAECEIRACGIEKGLGTCAECTDYVCDKLAKFFDVVPDAKATLDGLRADV